MVEGLCPNEELGADREAWSRAYVPVREVAADREAWSRAYASFSEAAVTS